MDNGIRLEAGDRTREGWRVRHIHELQRYVAMSRKQVRIEPPHQDQKLCAEVLDRQMLDDVVSERAGRAGNKNALEVLVRHDLGEAPDSGRLWRAIHAIEKQSYL